jgi:UTP--glucose-1-phosphate uridylyltransferase
VHELESELAAKGKQELLDLAQRRPPARLPLHVHPSIGAARLGHAVLCAQPIVGNEPFAVLLATT